MNTSNPIPIPQFIKDIGNLLDNGYKRIHKKLITILVFSLICAFVAYWVFSAVIKGKQAFTFPKTQDVALASPTPDNPFPPINPPVLLGATDCNTLDWKNFDKNGWSGLSWFSISDGVWTLPYPQTSQKDAVIYYKSSCAGGSLMQYQVIPQLENFLNINAYLRGQLRWEVGGKDRRSIRLWKNTVGCESGEIKGAIPITPNMFLPNHDEILINQPLIINVATFFLTNGIIRNELWLTYASKNNNGQVITTPRGTYYYDFEPGSICDKNHLPDINQESYQFGLGLQQASGSTQIKDGEQNIPELPKVSFDKFKISPFSNTN